MSLDTTLAALRKEIQMLAQDLTSRFDALDLSRDSLQKIQSKYNALSKEVTGITYSGLTKEHFLPPWSADVLNPPKISEKLAMLDLALFGELVLPSNSSNNLKTLRSLFLSADRDIDRTQKMLSGHPPVSTDSATFDVIVNEAVVKIIPSHKADNTRKTKEDIAEELGISDFSYFLSDLLPQLYFVVHEEFVATNPALGALSKSNSAQKEHFILNVVWYTAINSNSANLNKLQNVVGLTDAQIRAATFNKDLAVSSSAFFTDLLNQIEVQLNLVGDNLETSNLLSLLDTIKRLANTFLAQLSFRTTLVNDTTVLDDAAEAGVTATALESELLRREDRYFTGADFQANALLSTVFPPTNNDNERLALGEGLKHRAGTPYFTNKALREQPNLRDAVQLAAKNLVAATEIMYVVTQQSNTTLQDKTIALEQLRASLYQLAAAYDNFLKPPTPKTELLRGQKTMESAAFFLFQYTDFQKSLQIEKQLRNFAVDYNYAISDEIQLILDALLACCKAITIYLQRYHTKSLRDFIADAISISSATLLLFAEGSPNNSTIVHNDPGSAERLRRATQTYILNDALSEEYYSKVALQLADISSVLRGNEDEDLVGRLFNYPLRIIDMVWATNVHLENEQAAAFMQLRESFLVLKAANKALARDISSCETNFNTGFANAKFLVSKLAGDALTDLSIILGQN